jgi:hypothetical protein
LLVNFGGKREKREKKKRKELVSIPPEEIKSDNIHSQFCIQINMAFCQSRGGVVRTPENSLRKMNQFIKPSI